MDFKKSPDRSYGTLDQKAGLGEMIKPAETIDIVGVECLTLQDRRIWNALIANAHGPEMRQQDRDYKIDLTPLRSNHNGNERVEDSIERLMKTIAVCHMPNGSVTRFQLLGGNNMSDPMRPRGELTYTFDKRLIAFLSESVSFGKLEISVMAAFNSKYALALYEHISRRINLKHHFMKEYTIDDFRDVLGVGKNQLKAFGNLKQRAIMPALEEVNYWAPFRVHLAMKKTGQRVTSITMSWHVKDKEGRVKARSELEKSKDGRKARMKGIEESVMILSSDKLVNEQGDRTKIGRKARISGTVEQVTIELTHDQIEKGYNAAASICRIDKYRAYEDWKSMIAGFEKQPSNPVGHFIEFCKKRAREG